MLRVCRSPKLPLRDILSKTVIEAFNVSLIYYVTGRNMALNECLNT